MRLAVCLRQEGTVYRLAWFNESRQGLYFGHNIRGTEFHQSYHTTEGCTGRPIGSWYNCPLLIGLQSETFWVADSSYIAQ